MSQYVTYSLKAIKNQEILLAALAELGWDAGKVEVHETPQTLIGYHGDKREEKAHIIIRRHNTGVSSSNDIGFLKSDDGTYVPIISQYDGRACARGYGNRTYKSESKSLAEAVEKTYGRIAGDQAISTIVTKTIPRMKAQGLVSRYATHRVVQEGSVRRVVINDPVVRY